MEAFVKLLAKALPLALGIVLALLSVAYTVNVTQGNDVNDVIAALIFGLIGYPLLIAGALSLLIKNGEI